jgi:hypothetical protein
MDHTFSMVEAIVAALVVIQIAGVRFGGWGQGMWPPRS